MVLGVVIIFDDGGLETWLWLIWLCVLWDGSGLTYPFGFPHKKGLSWMHCCVRGSILYFTKFEEFPRVLWGLKLVCMFLFSSVFSFFFPFNSISRLPLSSYFKLIYFLYFIPLFIILDLVKPWFYLPIYNFFALFLILCLYAFCFLEDGHKFYLKCIWLQILTQL